MRILPAILLIFSALSQYVHPSPNCPPFVCGKLGELSFPYTNDAQNVKCGPYVVKGCNELDGPKVQFERGKRKWFKVANISQGGAISVIDTDFQALLDGNSCKSFTDFSFPRLPFAYPFKIISGNLTPFKCLPNVTVDSSLTKLYHNYTGCSPDFTIYYSPPNKHLQTLPGCTIIQLPVNTNNYDHSNIFQLLTPNFSLQAHVQPECYYCHLQGKCDGKSPNCPWNNPGGDRGANKKRLALGLGIGLGAGGLATILIFVSLWHSSKRKQASSSVFNSATKSSGDSSNTTLLNWSNAHFNIPIFSYDELGEATNNFNPQGELGDGGYGTVYYGILRDGREVAVKRLYERNYKKVMQFMNEIEILTRIRHPNLVSLYGCTSRHSRDLLLVYEYIPNGTVADHLHGDRAMPGQPSWPIRMRIAVETANALSYLHASEIIHRDVKTSNILLDMNFCVKVADFGISRLFPVDVTHVSTAPQGTPGYVDPEYYHCYQLTDKSDVYSFGVVLVELISSLPAVDITRERHEINLATLAMNKIQICEFEEFIDPNLGYNADEEIKRMITSVAELAFQCLQQDKEMRPSMDEVLEELIMIEGKENKLENSDEKRNYNSREKSAEALHKTQDCNEISSLQNMHPPRTSPSFTVDKWISTYTIHSI